MLFIECYSNVQNNKYGCTIILMLLIECVISSSAKFAHLLAKSLK
jgi:hypothetical protein